MAVQQLQHTHGTTVVPSDTLYLFQSLGYPYRVSSALFVGVGGSVRVLTEGGDDVVFSSVPDGTFMPVHVVKVFATGTTASSIVAVDLSNLSPFIGLLDAYSGAAAAYSLRQLSSSYSGSAIRVRRASDNTEQDIGFSNNVLDTTTLASFCSGTDGFVTTWYDQSGNGNDATQTTAANQPKIYDSSTAVITDNGNPSLSFDKTGPQYFNTGTQIGLANTGSIYVVSSIASIIQFNTHFANGYDADIWVGGVSGSNRLQIWTNNQNSQGSSNIFTLNTQFLASYFMKSGTDGHKIYVNNSNYLTSSKTFTIPNPTTTNGGIGRDVKNNDFPFDGKMQEILFFVDNEDTDNTGISTNINDFYSIY